MKIFISSLAENGRNFVLMATTGRAAKILSNKTNYPASTIHSHLYCFSGFNQDLDKMADNSEKADKEPFLLNFGLRIFDEENAGAVFIIDESSMISDKPDVGSVQANFGSGNLLKDLLRQKESVKFIFVGDECQLPPVNDSFSPALNKEYLERAYNLKTDEFSLTEIVRQKRGNDITKSAEKVRKLYYNPPILKWGQFPLRGYNNIKILPSVPSLISKYIAVIKEKGYGAATLITNTNKHCTDFANLIRPALGFNSNSLETGELLLVTQNNMLSGLMNGDLVKVIRVGRKERRAGLTFINVQVENIANGERFSQLLIQEILDSEKQINLSSSQQKALYIDFACRMKDKGIKSKNQQFQTAIANDPYLNALRTVYGYALTCYKAQGGEWPQVFLDIPPYITKEPKAALYQWLYTAMTRAVQTLYVVENFFITN
mgnify:FL=1